MLKFILNRLNDGETNPSQAHGQVLALAGPVPGPPPGRKTGLPKPEPVETSNVPTTRLNRHTQPDLPSKAGRNVKTPATHQLGNPNCLLELTAHPANCLLDLQADPVPIDWGREARVGYGRLR